MKFVVAGLAFGLSVWAQYVPDQYIVELAEPPAARAVPGEGAVAGRARAAHMAGLRQAQARVRRSAEAAGARVLDSFQVVQNAVVVSIPESRAPALASLPGVKRVHPVRLYDAVLDHSLPLQKVQDAWNRIGGMERAGAGVKIAIIDTGIDNTHPAFADPALAMPEGFPRTSRLGDDAYVNTKVIVARSYSEGDGVTLYAPDDTRGHGTAVAMIAAGATNYGPYGPITGVAPKAWLGNYKVFPPGSAGAPDSIIIRAIEDAVNDGMDVLNLSLGAFPAGRPDEDPLAMAVENAVSAGKVVVVASGNDGSNANTIASPGTAPHAIVVGSAANDRVFAQQVRVEGREPLLAVAGQSTSEVPVSGTLADVAALDSDGTACSSLPADSLRGRIALILRGVCLFEDKLNHAQAAGALAAVVYTDAARPEAIAMGTGSASLPAVMVSFADGSALKAAAVEQPELAVTVDFSTQPGYVDPNHLSDFSARGPNTDGGIKPDLVAVGGNIYTAGPEGGYTVSSGTSFSSPTVAGAAALLIGARPGLRAEHYTSLLVNSATTLGSGPPAVQSTGAGLLNLHAAVSNTVTVSPASLSFGTGPGTFARWRKVTLTNIGGITDTFSVVPVDGDPALIPLLSANLFTLEPGGSATFEVQMSAEGLPAAAYQGLLQVQAAQSGVATHVPYWYGVPSEVPNVLQVMSRVNPASGRPGRTGRFFFRFLDAAGLPVNAGVDATVASSLDMAVVAVDSADSAFPGAYMVTVRYGETAGNQVLHIELNGVGADITVPVR